MDKPMNGLSKEVITAKIAGAILMFVVSVIGSIAPLFYKSFKLSSHLKSMIILGGTAFVSGSFIGLVFFHLLPEAVEESLLKYNLFGSNKSFDFFWLALVLGIMASLLADKIFHGGEEHYHLQDIEESNHLVPESSDKWIQSAGSPSDYMAMSSTIEEYASRPSPKNGQCSCEIKQSLAPILTVILTTTCIAIHGVYDGLIIGSLQTATSVWIATLAVAGHKLPVAVAFSAFFVKKQIAAWLMWLALGTFALSTPLGILLGYLTRHYGEVAVSQFITGVSIGALIFFGVDLMSESMRLASYKKICMKKLSIAFGFILFGSFFVLACNILLETSFESGEHHHI